jgi:hypothetical protein
MGIVDVEYAWQINIDEQYPVRLHANDVPSTPKLRGNIRSASNSLYASHERHNPTPIMRRIDDENIKQNRQQSQSFQS